jgi:hypothetical protein
VADSLSALLYAIGQQESGGDYQADNGIAVGKYQVEKTNVPSWTAADLGKAMTWQQFLADPSAQDQVASAELGRLLSKYGAAGAASAWYSGDPNLTESTAPQKGGPSIKQYVDDVLKLMGQAPADGASVPATGTDAGLTMPGLPGLGSVLGGIPGGITDFFGQATDDLTASAAWVKAFFQPSTYIRIGAGAAGTVFLITGLVLLARAARGT